jgi:hypothetical protein
MKNNFNIDLIIERSMAAFGCKTQRQLSDIFSISPENFSAKKKRGTLTKLIEKEAYRKGISYDWIITGEGNMRKAGAPIAENAASYAPAQNVNSPSTGNNQDDYLTMTAAIIGTQSIFSTALKSNIEAFHSGIRLQQELAAARAMLTIHDEQLKSQRERMNTLEDLIRQKEDKKAG